MIRPSHWSYIEQKQMMGGQVSETETPFTLLQDTVATQHCFKVYKLCNFKENWEENLKNVTLCCELSYMPVRNAPARKVSQVWNWDTAESCTGQQTLLEVHRVPVERGEERYEEIKWSSPWCYLQLWVWLCLFFLICLTLFFTSWER